jgi:hypothetical protein
VLTLAQDVIAPQDNFTLNLYIVDDNYKRTEQTAGENITSNESATATVADEGLNGFGEDGIFDSDSAEALMEFLLSNPNARSGQGRMGVDSRCTTSRSRIHCSLGHPTPIQATIGR